MSDPVAPPFGVYVPPDAPTVTPPVKQLFQLALPSVNWSMVLAVIVGLIIFAVGIRALVLPENVTINAVP